MQKMKNNDDLNNNDLNNNASFMNQSKTSKFEQNQSKISNTKTNQQNKEEEKDEKKENGFIQYCQNHPAEELNYGISIDKKNKSQKMMCEVCQYTTHKNIEFINRKIFVKKDLKYMS